MDDEEAKRLLSEQITSYASEAESAGRRWDCWNRTLWWLGVGIAGAGVLVGYVGSLDFLGHETIKPWMVSAIASLGGSIEVVRRRTGWEALGNAYWAKYVGLTSLLRRLRFGNKARTKGDFIQSILDDLEYIEDQFGTARNAVMDTRQRPAKE